MKMLTKKLALGISALLLCIAAIDASACGSAVYRTYYLDRHCNYYYISNCDSCRGPVRVYTGQHFAGNRDLIGLPVHKSCDGRWYSQDAWGNRIYSGPRHCCRHLCG